MKIGDKVRFLNSVGGGIVRRFQGKDIVLIEEADGFETPALIRECVVVESDEMQVKSSSKKAVEKVTSEQPKIQNQKEEYKAEEIAGKDRLNICLAYFPIDIKDLGKCNYETFIINDSNYYLFLNYMSRENNAWKTRYQGEIKPNTRLFIEEFPKEQLNDLERICIQFTAFKKDKPFHLKNAYSVELRIDGVKFYKLHSFRENEFFEDEALIYPVVTNDFPERELLISTTELIEAMSHKIKIDTASSQPVVKKKNSESSIIEIDLHARELLDSTAGMTNSEILNVQLEKFTTVMEEYKSKKGQKIVFIHGKGEGVLRNAIITKLKQNYKNFPFQDASFREFGFGATMVTIK